MIWIYEIQILHLIKKTPTYIYGIYDINVINLGSWVYTDVTCKAKRKTDWELN